MSKYNSHNINEKTKNKLNQIKNKLGIPSLSYSKAIDYAVDYTLGKGISNEKEMDYQGSQRALSKAD